MARLSAEAVVRAAARAALDKKALDLAVLDLQGLSSVADFFLVCSGALHHPGRHHRGRHPRRAAARRACARATTRGVAESGWLLLDYGDVVMHVFLEETRGSTRSSACGATRRPFRWRVRIRDLADPVDRMLA